MASGSRRQNCFWLINPTVAVDAPPSHRYRSPLMLESHGCGGPTISEDAQHLIELASEDVAVQ